MPQATHHATSFWIGADSGRLYSCCIVRLGFCVRFPYNTCGGAHEATFSFEPKLGHGCGSCSADGGALFTEVPLAPDERLGAANHAQIPCCPTKGPTDCYRKNANRARRDPRFHFKDRHTASFLIPTMASVEPQIHRRNKHNTHTHTRHTHTHTTHTQDTFRTHTRARTHAPRTHALASRATHASRATRHTPHATRHAARGTRHTSHANVLGFWHIQHEALCALVGEVLYQNTQDISLFKFIRVKSDLKRYLRSAPTLWNARCQRRTTTNDNTRHRKRRQRTTTSDSERRQTTTTTMTTTSMTTTTTTDNEQRR